MMTGLQVKAEVPDHVGFAIKQHTVVAHPCRVCEVVLASYEVENACRPVCHQPSILQQQSISSICNNSYNNDNTPERMC